MKYNQLFIIWKWIVWFSCYVYNCGYVHNYTILEMQNFEVGILSFSCSGTANEGILVGDWKKRDGLTQIVDMG